MGHDRPLVLTDVWRACNKIRAAIFRCKGFDLRARLNELDPNKQSGGLISLDRFRAAFLGPLRNVITLSEQEVGDLGEYFSIADGRVHYGQLCTVCELGDADFSRNPDLVTGLEWEDPLRVNRIAECEDRRLCVLIVKIATVAKLRDICLRAYFQDYELVARDVGVASLEHFARVLHRCGITITDDDYMLLVKRYQRDRYTINYVAFCKAIDETVAYLDKSGLETMGEDVKRMFPNRLISAELAKSHRPEVGRVNVDEILDTPPVNFHNVLEKPREFDDPVTVMRRVQRHVLANRVRVAEFFEAADPLRCGRVSVGKFRTSLDAIGLSGLHRLLLSEREIDSIVQTYRDPNDASAVCWQTFDNDAGLVFTVKGLERMPDQPVECPPREVIEIPRQGAPDWSRVPEEERQLCESTVAEVRATCLKRGLELEMMFRELDPTRSGHVTRAAMRRVLLACSKLSPRELRSIEFRYLNSRGFDYRLFLSEVQPRSIEEPMYNQFWEEMKELNERNLLADNPSDCEKDIVLVLAKIKSVVVSRRVRVLEFVRDYDPSREGCVSRENFRRALEICGLGLTNTEYDTVANAFASPKRHGFVDHVRFSNCVEEAFVQLGLERAPLAVPVQHVPVKRSCPNEGTLSRDQRRQARQALELLARRPDRELNYLGLFEDYDIARCGSVSRPQFLRALSLRGSLALVSERDVAMVMRCFHVRRGNRDEVDYRAFLHCLDVTNATLPDYPF